MTEIKSEQREGTISKTVKERPVIDATGTIKTKTKPNNPRERLTELYSKPGATQLSKKISSEEREEMIEDLYLLSIAEMCEKYNKTLTSILRFAQQHMKTDYYTTNSSDKRDVDTDIDDLLDASFTKTVYGLHVVLQRKPQTLTTIYHLKFGKPGPATRSRTPIQQINLPHYLQKDYQEWIKHQGIQVYLQQKEEELKRIRKTV